MKNSEKFLKLKELATKYIREALPIGEFYVLAKAKGFPDQVVMNALATARRELKRRVTSR